MLITTMHLLTIAFHGPGNPHSILREFHDWFAWEVFHYQIGTWAVSTKDGSVWWSPDGVSFRKIEVIPELHAQ